MAKKPKYMLGDIVYYQEKGLEKRYQGVVVFAVYDTKEKYWSYDLSDFFGTTKVRVRQGKIKGTLGRMAQVVVPPEEP